MTSSEKRSCNTCRHQYASSVFCLRLGCNGPGGSAWESLHPPRAAVIDCAGLKCSELNCSSCFPAPPANPANPKQRFGAAKPNLALIPGPAAIHTSLALMDGAGKYGPFNWRETSVEGMTYIAAAKRHIDAWFDGEEVAADSGVHHLGHAIAGLMIILDAQASGKLIDNRPPAGGSAKLIAEKTKPLAN